MCLRPALLSVQLWCKKWCNTRGTTLPKAYLLDVKRLMRHIPIQRDVCSVVKLEVEESSVSTPISRSDIVMPSPLAILAMLESVTFLVPVSMEA